MIYLIDL